MLVTTFQNETRESGQRPYPYHITPDGMFLQQGLWKGKLYKLMGFQNEDGGPITLAWHSIAEGTRRAEEAIGKFMVYTDAQGNWLVMDTPVEEIRPVEMSEAQVDYLNRR